MLSAHDEHEVPLPVEKVPLAQARHRDADVLAVDTV